MNNIDPVADLQMLTEEYRKLTDAFADLLIDYCKIKGRLNTAVKATGCQKCVDSFRLETVELHEKAARLDAVIKMLKLQQQVVETDLQNSIDMINFDLATAYRGQNNMIKRVLEIAKGESDVVT